MARTSSQDPRNDNAKWEDVNNWELQVCLSVIEESFEEREFTEKEAEEYKRILRMPPSKIRGKQVPSLD